MGKSRGLALLLAALLAGCVTEQVGQKTVVNDPYAGQLNVGGNNAYPPPPPNDAYAQGPYDNNNYNPGYDRYSNNQYPDQYGPNQYGPDQYSSQVSFQYFHDRLERYGDWRNHPRWGVVWRPAVGRDFRPYFNGYWSNTREYGWLWVSDDPWGDTPYRYGRWVFDPRDGWLWVPGYVWGPSWVVWRSGGGNIGWFPMPPDDYYGNGAYRGSFENEYGYRDWYGPSFSNDSFFSLWVFVDERHFGDRDYRNWAARPRDHRVIINQTVDTTNYVTINNYVVNRSVDVNRLERVTNRRFNPVAVRDVVGRDEVIAPVNAGRQIEQRERQRGNFQPGQQFQGQGFGRGNVPNDRFQRMPDQPPPQGLPNLDNGRPSPLFGRGLREQANQPRQPDVQNAPQQFQGPPGQNDDRPGRGLGRPGNDPVQTNVPGGPQQFQVPPGQNDDRPGRGLGRPNVQSGPPQGGPPGQNNDRGGGFARPFREPPPNAPVVQPPPAPPQQAAQPERGGPGRGGQRVPVADTPSKPAAQNDNKDKDDSQKDERRRIRPGFVRP